MTSHRLRSLALVLALGCAQAAPPAPPPAGPPRLEFVPGSLAEGSPSACSPVSWSGSVGDSGAICLDASAAIEVPRSDVHSTRIEDRTVDGRTWYLVSAYLTEPLRTKLRDAFALSRSDAPYAVLIG